MVSFERQSDGFRLPFFIFPCLSVKKHTFRGTIVSFLPESRRKPRASLRRDAGGGLEGLRVYALRCVWMPERVPTVLVVLALRVRWRYIYIRIRGCTADPSLSQKKHTQNEKKKSKYFGSLEKSSTFALSIGNNHRPRRAARELSRENRSFVFWEGKSVSRNGTRCAKREKPRICIL